MPSNPPPSIDAGVRIGHVHLKVSDWDRSLAFYCGVLGFQLMQRFGSQAAFISAGGYHHHLGLQHLESLGGSRPRLARPDFTTSQFFIPHARCWPTPCAASGAPKFRSTARPTTV